MTSLPLVLDDEPIGQAADFYLSHYDNVIEDNRAASSELSGFYIEVPQANWNSPQWTSTSSFRGNAAHSCGSSGFYGDDFVQFPSERGVECLQERVVVGQLDGAGHNRSECKRRAGRRNGHAPSDAVSRKR